MIPITRRSEWGSVYGQGSLDPGPEKNVVIHHSYRPALTPYTSEEEERAAWKSIEFFHVRNNEWPGIGYNFGVAPSGRVYEGRGWHYSGAHAGPINSNSIGICLLIDGTVTAPSELMFETVRQLISLGLTLGEIDLAYQVSGHRDHMKRTCPGDKVYARLQEFRHDYSVRPFIPPGTRVWSNFHQQHLVVTKYRSNDEWYYIPENLLSQTVSLKALTLFDQMPKPRW